MSAAPSVVIVGAGLAGATAAWKLAATGWRVQVHEAETEVGGNLRTANLNGVRYEPHGPHIYHTSDEEVHQIVRDHVHLNSYRHHVKAELPDGRLLTWPLQVSELRELPEWRTIAAELDKTVMRPAEISFEAYAVSLMGSTLYSWFCEGYTRKQWGVDPSELSSRFAPKRLDLRSDGVRDMFRDKHQGYAPFGWEVLVQNLLGGRGIEVHLGSALTLRDLPDADYYVITAPLDQFTRSESLPWRGVQTRLTRYDRRSGHGLAAPVVNHSAMDAPWTRRVETLQMLTSGDPAEDELELFFNSFEEDPDDRGTVIATEYPGAAVRHYPVDDVAGENRARHLEIARAINRELPTAVLAGRLANYVYIDMDGAIRQGLNAARQLIKMHDDR